MDEQLQPLREQIDTLDAQILALLNQRAQVAQQVGEVKKEFNAPVFRPERELQVIARVEAANQGPLLPDSIAAIWREIMSACRALEKRCVVACLGPAGTYSEQAVFNYFGRSVEVLTCPTMDEVFRATESGAADFGVVPVENSSEGAVSRTLDLLLQTPLKISGEVALPIHHTLYTQSGEMTQVTTICAHSQALAQCQRWLNQHYPKIARQSVASNAEAVRLAQDDPSIAGIAGDAAATVYNVKAVASHIQDDAHNKTRFLVVGHDETGASGQSGQDQTSMILSVPNKPGAVVALLQPLADHGVSMTRLESRPARQGAWEYYFYVDIEGHQHDANVVQALRQLKEQAAFMKVLGSYPKSVV